MEIAAVYYIVINFAAFVIYGADKFFAKKKKRRVPEKRLIGIAFLGGAFGALLGMYLFRHKTRHAKFRALIPLSAVLHTAIVAAVFWGREIFDFLSGVGL